MGVSANQFYIFLACLFCGLVSGALFEGLKLPFYFFKNRVLEAITDGIFFILFALLYVWISFLFAFPSFRIYMPVGALTGFFLYCKTFGAIVANFREKLYNKVNKQRRRKRRDRRKG